VVAVLLAKALLALAAHTGEAVAQPKQVRLEPLLVTQDQVATVALEILHHLPQVNILRAEAAAVEKWRHQAEEMVAEA
jgi:hypothetical protein